MSRFQSPQRGLFISYPDQEILPLVAKKFQSPQRGLFISYPTPALDLPTWEPRFSPLSGDCLFLTQTWFSWYRLGIGFSPLSGDCLFLTSVYSEYCPSSSSPGFSPLSGDCLFLTTPFKIYLPFISQFQSPQRGLFISY